LIKLSVKVSLLDNFYIFLDQSCEHVSLKLRGLPFQIKNTDISTFFSGYKYVPDSIIIGRNQDGRPNGFGAILFETELECKKALSER
jgi:RNA recognition motif-containing protein